MQVILVYLRFHLRLLSCSASLETTPEPPEKSSCWPAEAEGGEGKLQLAQSGAFSPARLTSHCCSTQCWMVKSDLLPEQFPQNSDVENHKKL